MSLLDTIDTRPPRHLLPSSVPLSVSGTFDAEATLRLRPYVVAAVTDGAALVLLDLSGVTSVTPSAVAGMLEFLRMARAAGGDFRVHGRSAALTQAHDTMRLTSVIRVYETESDAIASGF